MKLDSYKQATALVARIEKFNALLDQIASAANAPRDTHNEAGEVVSTEIVGSIIRSAVVSREDGGHEQALIFPPELAITVEETNKIGEILTSIVLDRLTKAQAELAAI